MQESEETFKMKKSSSKKFAFNKDREALDKDLEPLTITSRATVGNNVSYSKEAMDELRRTTQSKTPSTHISDDSLLEEKFPMLLGGKDNKKLDCDYYKEAKHITEGLTTSVFVMCI